MTAARSLSARVAAIGASVDAALAESGRARTIVGAMTGCLARPPRGRRVRGRRGDLALRPRDPRDRRAPTRRSISSRGCWCSSRTSTSSPTQRAKLIEGAIKGMVAELDPHSAYMPPDEFALFQGETEGKFGGVGVEVDFRERLRHRDRAHRGLARRARRHPLRRPDRRHRRQADARRAHRQARRR